MDKHRSHTLVSLILAGEIIFFLPFVLVRIFRPTILIVFKISNAQLGSYFAIYGIVAMASYLFGGPLADRFASRKLISFALWLTAVGGFLLYIFFNKSILPVLYAFWGLSTIFLFWASLIKATRKYGGDTYQGRSFGWLEGGRGLIAALTGSIALFLFSSFINEVPAPDERIRALRIVVLFVSIITLLTGLLTWYNVPDDSKNEPKRIPDIRILFHLMVKTPVWMLSILILCAYSGYKITDDFSLYAKEVLGYTEVEAAGVGTAALWIRALVAVGAGYVSDRTDGAKVIVICFTSGLLAGILIAGNIMTNEIMIFLNLLMVMIGVYGVRALYFTLIHYSNIPLVYTGTVVGIVSIAGFTPDIFMGPWMGHLLDSYPGLSGHQHVFLVFCGFSFIGLLTSLYFLLGRNRIRIKG